MYSSFRFLSCFAIDLFNFLIPGEDLPINLFICLLNLDILDEPQHYIKAVVCMFYMLLYFVKGFYNNYLLLALHNTTASPQVPFLTLSMPYMTIVSLSHLIKKVPSQELFSAQSLA